MASIFCHGSEHWKKERCGSSNWSKGHSGSGNFPRRFYSTHWSGQLPCSGIVRFFCSDIFERTK